MRSLMPNAHSHVNRWFFYPSWILLDAFVNKPLSLSQSVAFLTHKYHFSWSMSSFLASIVVPLELLTSMSIAPLEIPSTICVTLEHLQAKLNLIHMAISSGEWVLVWFGRLRCWSWTRFHGNRLDGNVHFNQPGHDIWLKMTFDSKCYLAKWYLAKCYLGKNALKVNSKTPFVRNSQKNHDQISIFIKIVFVPWLPTLFVWIVYEQHRQIFDKDFNKTQLLAIKIKKPPFVGKDSCWKCLLNAKWH